MSQSHLRPGPHPVSPFPGLPDYRLTFHHNQNDAQPTHLSTGSENPRVPGAHPLLFIVPH